MSGLRAVLYLLGQLIPHDQPAAVRPYNPARTQAERSK
jgi:hypothetical protein